MTRPPVWILSVLFALVGASPAMAGTFDEITGRYDVSDAAFSYSLDQALPSDSAISLTLLDFGGQVRVPDGFFEAVPEGFEGSGALSLPMDVRQTIVNLEGLQAQFAGRRVEIKLWMQPRGIEFNPRLSWISGNLDGVLAGQDDRFHTIGRITMQPTGRATDDGWREYSSGPVDFMLAGTLPLSLLVLDNGLENEIANRFFPLPIDETLSTAIDAFEILDLGPAAVPTERCQLLNERQTCGEVGVCYLGRCTDHAAVYGAQPTALIRRDYLERRITEAETFSGVRIAREVDFAGQMRALADAPARDFWVGMRAAYMSMVDGHGNPPSASGLQGVGTGSCVYLSRADLTPGVDLAPMVWATDSRTTLGQQLQRGDVIRTVDGLTPSDWIDRNARYFYYNGDPRGRDIHLTSDLMRRAAFGGSILEFVRCTRTDGPCTEADLEIFTVDLGAQADALWDETLGQTLIDLFIGTGVPCDFRFTRAFQDDNVVSQGFADWLVDGDNITTLLINGVPSSSPRNGSPSWYQAVTQALGSDPSKVLLDQRLGQGGVFEGVLHITGFLMPPSTQILIELFPWFDGPLDTALAQQFRQCIEVNNADIGAQACGGAGATAAINAANSGLASDSRLAMLLGRDVSGNDYLTRLLSLRDAPTRSFGPGPTYGAFGAFCSMASLLREAQSATLQCSDTVFRSDDLDTNLMFESGVGVMPDEVVYQTQSDAIVGTDTTVEAARTWLNSEEGTNP